MEAGHRGTGRRLTLALVAALLVAAGAVAGCGASEGGSGGGGEKQEGEAGKPQALRVAYQAIPNGAMIVKNQKWLEDSLGIPVEWQSFDSGANVNRAVASGSVDVGLAGSSPVSNGIASGLPYKVPWIYDIIGDAEQLVVRKSAGVSDLKGLEGKKVAAPFGSTTHYALLTAMTDAGVDLGKVDVIDLEPDDIVAAWQRDDIDAGYVWNPSLAKLKEQGGTVLLSSRELAEQGTLTGDLAVVRTEFAEQYPDVVAGWLKQENRAVELYKADPQRAAEIVGKELQLPTKEAVSQMEGLIFLDAKEQLSADYLGTPDQPGKLAEQLTTTAQFLKEQELIDREPSPDEFKEAVDSQFLQKASGS
jgi:taurine transport system substrate-binding protein